jgi:hypothetical protein
MRGPAMSTKTTFTLRREIMGIREALREHQECEGRAEGIRVAQSWQAALEDMADQANEAEKLACCVLMQPINSYLKETA